MERVQPPRTRRFPRSVEEVYKVIKTVGGGVAYSVKILFRYGGCHGTFFETDASQMLYKPVSSASNEWMPRHRTFTPSARGTGSWSR